MLSPHPFIVAQDEDELEELPPEEMLPGDLGLEEEPSEERRFEDLPQPEELG